MKERRKVKKLRARDSLQEHTLNLGKKLQVAMKENSLSKINMRHKTGYMHINCWLSTKHKQTKF